MNTINIKITLVALALLLLVPPTMAAIAGKITREVIEECVERAAKRSGRKGIEKAAKKSAGETLEQLAKHYGNDAIRVVDDAGLELLEAIPKYGDDVAALAMKSSPQARRAFACNIPDLLPLARRVGTEALELEAKSPGLATKFFQVFGDDAAKVIAKNIPSEDLPRLLKYADAADSPATRELLLKSYQREGKELFTRIPPKLVLAGGLTATMLYGTHQLTSPARAISKAIASNEDLAETATKTAIHTGVFGITVLLLFGFGLISRRFGLMPWQRRRQNDAKTPPASDSTRCRQEIDQGNARNAKDARH